MTHAKLFSVLVIAALLIYAIVGFYFLPLAGFEGDLTRIGKLPEAEFGWTKPQPAIPAELLRQAEWQEADVLVVGDSFSLPHLWQTVLTQHGQRVRTELWENIRSICEDFTPWVRSQGFKGHYIVLESVERHAESVIDRSTQCRSMSYHAVHYPSALPPAAQLDRQHPDYSGKLSVGLQTRFNLWKYAQLSRAPNFKQWELADNVRMERLADGCDLFSHRRCQDVLFLREDRVQDMNPNMLSQMATIDSRLSEFSILWVIVPDKSTTYLAPHKQLWNQMTGRFHAPNLLAIFRLAIQNKTVDLYPGNNTHLSTAGYLLMGEAIRQEMLSPRF